MPRAVNGRKICTKCRVEKAVEEFSICQSSPDDLQYRCKACYSHTYKVKKQSAPKWIRKRLILECCGCGVSVKKYPSQIRDSLVFCSILCRNKNYKKAKPDWKNPNAKPPTPHICGTCDKEFWTVPSRVGHFCSGHCSAVFASSHVKRGPLTVETKDKISNTLRLSGVSKGKNNYFWVDGKSRELYGPEFYDKHFKTSIRKHYNFTCVMCGKNGHIIHHIDRDKKNNATDNLIVVCKSDHMLIHQHYQELTPIVKSLIKNL